MRELRPGDVVVVPFPYTDLTAAKVRPALVLSDADFNASGEDVVVCAMTSRLVESASSVIVSADDLASGELPRPSRVKVAKVVTIAKSVVRRRVARLKPAVFARVMREYEALFTNG